MVLRHGEVCFDWTPARDKQLRAYRRDKIPYTEIARTLRTTKGSVASRCRTIGLCVPIAEARHARKQAAAAKAPPRAPVAPKSTRFPETIHPAPATKHPAEMRRVTLLDLAPGQCRFPLGPKMAIATHFCGNNVAVDRPYCAHHCAVSFIRPGRAVSAPSETAKPRKSFDAFERELSRQPA